MLIHAGADVMPLAETLTVPTMLAALSAAVAADDEQVATKILAVVNMKDPEAAAGAVAALAYNAMHSELLVSLHTHMED